MIKQATTAFSPRHSAFLLRDNNIVAVIVVVVAVVVVAVVVAVAVVVVVAAVVAIVAVIIINQLWMITKHNKQQL